MEVGVALIITAVVLFGVGILLRRARPDKKAILADGDAQTSLRSRRGAEPEEELDVVNPRPKVVDFGVHGPEARVTFAVALPEGDDEVLSELLVAEAIEVIREKRHTLPITEVHEVVALATSAGETREMGRASLDTPGELPPADRAPSMLNLAHIATDPLERSFHEEEEAHVPETVARSRPDTLSPIGSELRLPKAVDTGLRAQGVDPSEMSAADLVTGMLGLVGYQVSPGAAEGVYYASKPAGGRTIIREDRYSAGDHPEVDEETIRRFLFEFESSGADRGIFVSEKFAPFSIYEMERREPRIRFVTRERLQKFVDALSLG